MNTQRNRLCILFLALMLVTPGCNDSDDDGTPSPAVPTAEKIFALERSASSRPDDVTPATDKVWFTADDGVHGRELWVKDAGGTHMVKDITPGNDNTHTANLTAAGDLLFFTVDEDGCEDRLWVSDGTPGGTTRVAGADCSLEDPPVVMDKRLFFVATDETHGAAIWVCDMNAGPRAQCLWTGTGDDLSGHLTVAGDTLYFLADDAADQEQLWKYTGTGDPSPVNLGTAEYGSPDDLTAAGNQLYFSVWDKAHNKLVLLKIDGLTEGPQAVGVELDRDRNFKLILLPAGKNLFIISDYYTGGFTLWCHDGDGTQLVQDFPKDEYTDPLQFATTGDDLYFSASDTACRCSLWHSDGTVCTRLIDDIDPQDYVKGTDLAMTIAGERLYFSGHKDGKCLLWSIVDGTPELLDLHPAGNFDISSMSAAGDTLILTAHDGVHGEELWTSDGTADGTTLIRDINRFYGDYAYGDHIELQIDQRGRLYLAADDGIHGKELWTTAGSGGLSLLDINPDGASNPECLVPAVDRMFFITSDDNHNRKRWVTDGTMAGTKQINVPEGQNISLDRPKPTNNRLFYCVDNFLWGTDGTPAGTKQIVGPDNQGFIYPSNLTPAGNRMFFITRDGTDYKYWVTDGTPAGTKQITAPEGQRLTGPEDLTLAGDLLYFTDRDETDHSRLWVLDATVPGTTTATRLDAPALPQFCRLHATGQTIFFAARDESDNDHLWFNDGTGASLLLTDLEEDIRKTVVVGPKMFIVLRDGSLLVSDGTKEGTRRLPAADVAYGTWPVALGDRLFFIGDADDKARYSGPSGNTLWVSDGTPDGTRELPLPSQDSAVRHIDYIIPTNGDLYVPVHLMDETYRLYRLAGEALTEVVDGKGRSFTARTTVVPVDGRTLVICDNPERGLEIWRLPR